MTQLDFSINSLGHPQWPSPLSVNDANDSRYFVRDDQFILFNDQVNGESLQTPQSPVVEKLEIAGPRRHLFFKPTETRLGIVTCGGLCPGLNDVIRGLVMESQHRYGISHVYGFRNGYRGCGIGSIQDVVELNVELVSEIHEQGGTILGTSRGPQDAAAIVDNLVRLKINILCIVGGDGTMRGGLAIVNEINKRGLKIAVVGLPKTIDNDIKFIDKSFGFETAYSKAVDAIYSAHNEAHSVPNGIGIVKLMGRHSGFIACYATLATSHVNFALIPESPFCLDGPDGLFDALRDRLHRRRHAVIVVAEGAGQEVTGAVDTGRDASGNLRLADIGGFLKAQITNRFKQIDEEANVKYIDPSYIIRSGPANAADSVLCWRLAQSAVHAGMCGKTAVVVGLWHGRFVHIPMRLTASSRKQVDINGELWASVLESTGQVTRAPSTA